MKWAGKTGNWLTRGCGRRCTPCGTGLIPEEAAHLGAQLPMLIRGIYYEGWSPAKTPEKIRDKNTFLERVRSKLDGETTAGRTDPETLSRAVFKLLRHRISEGEVRDIESCLPQELADLWPRARKQIGNPDTDIISSRLKGSTKWKCRQR
jgi:uncharacterized protein (DUF2267 family)